MKQPFGDLKPHSTAVSGGGLDVYHLLQLSSLSMWKCMGEWYCDCTALWAFKVLYKYTPISIFSRICGCWWNSCTIRDILPINRLIHKAGPVIDSDMDKFKWSRDRTLDKLLSIMDCPIHLLHQSVDRQQWSFSRFLQLCCHTEQYRTSFIQFSSHLKNSSPPCRR